MNRTLSAALRQMSMCCRIQCHCYQSTLPPIPAGILKYIKKNDILADNDVMMFSPMHNFIIVVHRDVTCSTELAPPQLYTFADYTLKIAHVTITSRQTTKTVQKKIIDLCKICIGGDNLSKPIPLPRITAENCTKFSLESAQ